MSSRPRWWARPEGQGGPELQSLRGQTVPVRLNGPFTAIGYSIAFAGLVQEMARQKLEDKAKARQVWTKLYIFEGYPLSSS